MKDLDKHSNTSYGCSCSRKTIKLEEASEIGGLLEAMMAKRKGSKTTIKLEIEFSD